MIWKNLNILTNHLCMVDFFLSPPPSGFLLHGLLVKPGLRREWPISEITPRLRNQTHVSAALCCTLLTGQKHRGASLSSHCNLLRDTVAATVQLAWPGIWRAGLSFSQMPVAFQLGKCFFLRCTGNYLKEKEKENIYVSFLSFLFETRSCNVI